MAQVKICGIMSQAAYRAAKDAGAAWVGLNFYPPSPRFISGSDAQAIGANDTVARVGLFVEPDAAIIAAVLDQVTLDILQLYTDPATCRAIRTRFGVPVWRAIGVSTPADLPADNEGLDGFIIESKPPPGATRPGGNAVPLDWSLTRHWRAPAPWLLAGGLTPANVAQAIAASGATAVDVSSGVEDAPGRKSAAMIENFIRAANK